MDDRAVCPNCGHDRVDEDGGCQRCHEPDVGPRAEPMLDHALALARRGYAVFPLKSKSKHPACKNGCKDGSTDPEAIEKLFGKKRSPNIGIATGSPSGIWVLDLDGPEGIAAFGYLADQHGGMPETISIRTGGGGEQHYFKLNGEPIKNRAKISGEPIDCRGAGGYVVAPPSIHPNGKRYEWIDHPNDVPIAAAPPWLVAWILDGGDTSPNPLSSGGLSFTVGEDLDLAAHPGAEGPKGEKKGSRHETAKRLIGAALAKGLDPVEVANQAVAWAGRCDPPADTDDILRLVSDLAKKDGAKVAEVRREIEEEPLPVSVPWPELHEDALHGLAGEIVRTIEPETESDPVAILGQLLVGFGCLVGRGPHYVVEGTPHYPNTFTVLVGSTSRGRKGTSEGRIRQLLRFVDEDWATDRILTGLVSGEGLVWGVRDPICKTEPIKEKGKIVDYQEVLADPGIEDKRLLVVEPEFAGVLRVCKRESNTLSPTMRSAWDSGSLRTMAKNSPARATDAHVSIVGHITEPELKRSLAEVESFSGFSNRILWFLVRRSKLLPEGGRDLDLSQHAQRLKYAVEFARDAGRMYRDDEATRLWRDIYAEINDGELPGLVGAVTSRGEAQTLRLSLIYAILDRAVTIRAEHLRAAYAVWRYAEESARRIFAGSTGDTLADRVLAVIKQHKDGIGRWALHRAIGKDHKAQVLVEVLAQLRDAGRITRDTRTTTGGRPAEIWLPITRRGPEVAKVSEVSLPETPEASPPIKGDTSDILATSGSNMEEITI